MAGLRTVTDGEFRSSSWLMDFIYSLGGVERCPARRDQPQLALPPPNGPPRMVASPSVNAT